MQVHTLSLGRWVACRPLQGASESSAVELQFVVL